MSDEKHAPLGKSLKKILFESRRFVQKCHGRFLTAAVVVISFFTVVVFFSLVQFLYNVNAAYSGSQMQLSATGNLSFEIAVEKNDFSQASWYRDNISYSYDFETLLTPVGSFVGVKFLIVATSAVENFVHRDVIRRTWGAELRAKFDSKLVFLLGTTSNRTLQQLVERESSRFGDLLQFGFHDTYDNLTTKSIVMLNWSRKWKTDFLVKIDDDVMLNVDLLRSTIENIHPTVKRFIAGFALFDSKPVRESWSKFFVSRDDYSESMFPAYVAGMIYVITGEEIEPLYEAALTTPPMKFEDIYVTGFLPTKLVIPRIGLSGIDLFEKTSDCEIHKTLAVQLSDTERLKTLQAVLDRTVRICKPWVFSERCSCRDTTDQAIAY